MFNHFIWICVLYCILFRSLHSRQLVFSRAVSQLCSLNGNSFCMKSHSFSKDVWDLTEWSLLIGWKEWSHDFRVRVCCFLLEKDTMLWCHLGETTETNFQSNFKPQTRQDTTTPRGGNHDTTEDSISSLILSQKPGKTPRHHRGGNHDTTEDSISSLILSQKPGKTPRHHRGGNHDTTEDSISSLILSQKPGKTPQHHGVETTTPWRTAFPV